MPTRAGMKSCVIFFLSLSAAGAAAAAAAAIFSRKINAASDNTN